MSVMVFPFSSRIWSLLVERADAEPERQSRISSAAQRPAVGWWWWWVVVRPPQPEGVAPEEPEPSAEEQRLATGGGAPADARAPGRGVSGSF
jgi:hypothetical protein